MGIQIPASKAILGCKRNQWVESTCITMSVPLYNDRSKNEGGARVAGILASQAIGVYSRKIGACLLKGVVGVFERHAAQA
ncbi:hypothetical protein PAESOLCIP111_04301 [Paenibacillus solanacearum]|uniref:Uncharacterized protein n=1 Tax=Paenibacillus solanacearum TaxID=2048548 RepID=A0A916NQU9_9BACL|nr:hypothetical protein PAESOLCIP111_04301 [Paenibacillus solanacearum]